MPVNYSLFLTETSLSMVIWPKARATKPIESFILSLSDWTHTKRQPLERPIASTYYLLKFSFSETRVRFSLNIMLITHFCSILYAMSLGCPRPFTIISYSLTWTTYPKLEYISRNMSFLFYSDSAVDNWAAVERGRDRAREYNGQN